MTEKTLDKKDMYIHRDISWLMFNERVLEEAVDSHNPLMERLRFISIFVNNLDEFYMVRVAGLKNLLSSKYNNRDQFGYYPQELADQIKSQTDVLVKRLYDVYSNKIVKELEKNDVFIKNFEQLNPDQRKSVKRFFETTLFPIITPMAVDQGRPFPVLPSKTIAFAVSLAHKDENVLAIIPIPKNVPRLFKLPTEKNELNFIPIEEVIRQNLNVFFRGYKINDFTLFRVIKDSEVTVDEELTPDLLKAIEGEVRKRSWASVVYLEIEKSCTKELLETLCSGLNFPQEEVVNIANNLDLSYCFELAAQIGRTDLSFKPFSPVKVPYENIFTKISEGDFILHLPYQSFYPTISLIQEAAQDPNVLAIKMTLYRANENSAIIESLKEAAYKKKQVTVLVEIRARFDEEKNINWVRELEEAGCHVIYGLAGLKIHSKITLIVRREEEGIRRYVHLSTGNYNEKTARVYTDIGYFTSNDDFARDISDVFNVITGFSVPSSWKRIISSPNDLRKYFFDLVDREISYHKKDKNGLIVAKMNSLEDTKMIDKLYEASKAGVKIKLIVRGICSLVPGVPGLSENIEVRSIVGRFLEHSRIFVFHNNDNPRVFVSSADWMGRNFDRRIELMFEINKEDIKEHLENLMKLFWKDNVKARTLQSNRQYLKEKSEEDKFNVQEYLLTHYGG